MHAERKASASHVSRETKSTGAWVASRPAEWVWITIGLFHHRVSTLKYTGSHVSVYCVFLPFAFAY